MRKILPVLGLMMALGACGKKTPATTETPPATTETPPATTEAPPATTEAPEADADTAQVAAAEPADTVEAAPETPEDKTAQCARILEKSWKAAQPAYAKLGIEVIDELEKEYRESSYETRKFLEGCPTVSKGYRDCMEAAANPIENADPCRQSAGTGEPQLGRPPMPAPKVAGRAPSSAISTLFERPPLDEAAKKAAAKKLVGTWLNKSPFGTTTWTIAGNGDVTEVETRDDKPGDPKTFGITPATDNTVSIKYSSNNQTRAFHWLSDTEFLCEGNLMWLPSFMGDGTSFTVLNGFDAVFVDGDSCEAVTNYGSLVPATCAFAERDGKRTFDVSYQVPGKVRYGTTEPEPTKASFLVSGNFLVPAKLMGSLYVKQ